VLLAHVRENDLRSELRFIDRAYAVAACKALLDLELGRYLSDEELAEQLNARGYGLSASLIALMLYAVDRLAPAIPVALDSGLTREAVQRIRRLDAAAEAQWAVYDAGGIQPFDEAFEALCTRYDGPDWCFEDLEDALAMELADAAEVSLQTARLALRTAQTQGAITSENEDPAVTRPASETKANRTEVAPRRCPSRSYSRGFSRPVAGEQPDLEIEENDAPTDFAEPEESERPDGPTTSLASGSFANTDRSEPADARAVPPARTGNAPLKSARARCWTIAQRLAGHVGLGELIVPTPREGLGYLVTDIPDAGFIAELATERSAVVNAVWQHLVLCCELTTAPDDKWAQHVAPALSHALRRDRQTADPAEQAAALPIIDNGAWCTLDDRCWREYIALMEARRQAHQTAAGLGVPLWGGQ